MLHAKRTIRSLIGLALLGAGFLLAPAFGVEAGYPLTVKDHTGYSLTLADKPKAVVSLTLATDEMLLEMIDLKRLSAMNAYSTDAGISNVADFAKTFPRKIAAEKETVIALQPDLVFVASWKDKEFVQALRDAKVPVFVFKAPDNFEELALAIDQVATLIGEKAKGKALMAKVEARLTAVAAAVAKVPKDKRPTVLSYTFYGSTYGIGTSFDALVTKAGLVNAASKAGMSGWPQLSKEQIIALDPDIVALPSWSFDGTTDPAKYLEQFVKDPVFASLKAVKNKRVFIFQDKHMQATSQYMVDGVEDLARAAWPELFKK